MATPSAAFPAIYVEETLNHLLYMYYVILGVRRHRLGCPFTSLKGGKHRDGMKKEMGVNRPMSFWGKNCFPLK